MHTVLCISSDTQYGYMCKASSLIPRLPSFFGAFLVRSGQKKPPNTLGSLGTRL